MVNYQKNNFTPITNMKNPVDGNVEKINKHTLNSFDSIFFFKNRMS